MIVGNNVACTTPVVEYQLTISSTEGGSVTTPGEGKHTYCQEQGLVVDMVAIPDPGYHFVNWTGDVDTITDINASITTIAMNDDCSITANFVKQYCLTVYTMGGGSVTAPGEGTYTYDAGTRINLVAQANAGYQFVNWVGTVGTIANVGAATTTITMNDDCSIAANFIKKQYRLTISSTAGGSVTTPGQGVFTRDAGTVVNLVASPAAGYRFVNWTGNVGTVANVSAASTTITMNGDCSITANFARQYALTISTNTGGSVTTPGVGTHTYDAGTVVNLVATPDAGYRFVNWTGNVSAIADANNPTTTITMNGHYSIGADFRWTCEACPR